MRTAASVFGADWRAVDVLRVSTPDQRRACGVVEDRAEMITFGTACNALILSVRRVDDVNRRWHSGDRERYAVLRPGQWTLRDLEAAFVLWRAGERYVRGLGPACEALMNIFFGQADARPEEHAGAPDVAAIFQAIVDAAQAAQGAYGTRDVLGWQAHATVMEWVAQVESLARSGLVVCGIKTC